MSTATAATTRLHTLTRSDGSTLYSQGKTTVIVGVNGPVECRQNKMSIDKAYIEMNYKRKSGMPNVGDRLNEAILRNICQTSLMTMLHPRTAIVITVQEMENGGDLIASAVNAICLALMDAGLDMHFMMAAAACCMNADGELTIDPNRLQEENAVAHFMFVFDSMNSSIIASHTTGSFSIAKYREALHLCRESSNKMFDFYKETLRTRFSKYLIVDDTVSSE